MEKLNLEVIANSEFFKSLNGVAFAAIFVLLATFMIGFVVLITRKFPKVHLWFLKIKDMIFWNFLIRYFQVAFISFNYGALNIVLNTNGGFKDIASSIFILALQYLIVIIIAIHLSRKDLLELGKSETRKRIGNLYDDLDTRKRQRVLYGVMYFLQRCSLVFVVAFKYSFGL